MKSLPCLKSMCYKGFHAKKTTSPINNILPFQPELRPALPTIEGNVDYQEFRRHLERMDEILVQGGLENKVLTMSLKRWMGNHSNPPSPKQVQAFQFQTRKAFRCNHVRTLLGEGFREMSCRMADSALLQRFCLIDRLDTIRVPSKSTLQRYSEWFSVEEIQKIHGYLLNAACEEVKKGQQALDLKEPLGIEEYFLDTSCIKANVHFPVDWVLLRDGTRTLMKAVKLIRRHGLRHRMAEPATFPAKINALSMAMSAARRQADSRRQRKKILRRMKQLTKVVAAHARRYRGLLDTEW